MSRRPARATKSDIRRALEALDASGARGAIEIAKDGTITIIAEGLPRAVGQLASPPRKDKAGFIYFIKNGARRGPIKIGFSTAPKKRLRHLQTSSSAPLILLGTRPGTVEHERELHARFKHLRLQGEWFSPAAEILAYITEVTR